MKQLPNKNGEDCHPNSLKSTESGPPASRLHHHISQGLIMLPFSKRGSKQIVAFSSRSQQVLLLSRPVAAIGHGELELYIYIVELRICRNTIFDSVFIQRN